jgi:ubiquinone/menaquinone biosynthesis C-methylase UbiE
VGVDIVCNLVEAGNRRAAEIGLKNCTFRERNATNLRPLADQFFDMVVAIVGAMFAPKTFDVAKEIVRVTRRAGGGSARADGRIVMGNWIPNDPTLVAQILKNKLRLHAPAPARIHQPDDMGRREQRHRTLRRCRRPCGEVRLRARHFHL